MNLLDHFFRTRRRGRYRRYDFYNMKTTSAGPDGQPFAALDSFLFLRAGAPWTLSFLDDSLRECAIQLPPGMYRLAFHPNSPGALEELIIDPDPGTGEPLE